ncbi:MAG: hypothetical protein ABJD07_03295 [Gemmatimonadaceae bacterium]
MRTRLAVAVTMTIALAEAGCRSAQESGPITPGVGITNPVTNLYGEWLLDTNPDSTGFVGAKRVEMTLKPGAFSISAVYPDGGAPLTISGDAARMSDSLRLTLVPRTISASTGGLSHPSPFTVNDTVTVVASAAGRTMVFSQPQSTSPTSVWHRLDNKAP